MEKLYSVIRPAAQSSYIRQTGYRLRLSALPLSSTLRLASFLRRPVPCHWHLTAASRAVLHHAVPAPTSIADGRGHRRKAHRSGYSGMEHWRVPCPYLLDNDNDRKACCSACSPHRTATSPQSDIFTNPEKICVVPSLHFLRRFAICSCTCRKTCSLIIGSCVSSTRTHSLWGLRILRLFLKEMFVSR